MPVLNSEQGDRPTPLGRLWQEHAGTGAAADAAYATLRQAILVGQLRPGDRLGEEQLAGEFGISRTPIREAIFRLEAERFATRQVRRGLVVRGIPEEQVLEVFTVWAALDQLAARIAAQNATAPERARLHWINEQIDARTQQIGHVSIRELTMQFHDALSECAHNTVLLEIVRQLHDSARRFGETTFSLPGRASVAIAEHRAILAAIDTGEADLAGRLAAEHISNARQARIALMRRTVDESTRASHERGAV
jgi:DNA-binding GntR family transcriptional regulator